MKMGSLRKHHVISVFTMVLLVMQLAGCGGGDDSGTPEPNYVSGRVIYTDKLVGATVAVHDTRGGLLAKVDEGTGSEGLYSIPATGLPSFTIVVTGGKTPDGATMPGYLKRRVQNFDPLASYEVNGLTTLVAVYQDRHPELSYDQAVMAVARYLDLPDAATFHRVSRQITTSDARFSDRSFWNSVAGMSYDKFIASVMAEIEAGKVVNFADKSLTADLSPLAFNAATPASKRFGAETRAAPAIGAVLSLAFSVFEGAVEIFDMQEDEANVETLNKISKDVDDIKQQLSIVETQLASIKDKIDAAIWSGVQTTLVNIEANCLQYAIEEFDSVIAAKTQIAKRKGALNTPTDAEKQTLKNHVKNFNRYMTHCDGSSAVDFRSLMVKYATTITREDNDRKDAALELFARALPVNDPNCSEECSYKAIENTFLRFVAYQAAGVQLNLYYAYTKGKEDGTKYQGGSDPDWLNTKSQILKEVIEGTRLYDRQMMIKQINRLVPAVERYVVRHEREAWYRRWLACDLVSSLAQSGDCDEYERPLLRSQVITDQLLGSFKDSSGTRLGPKYGLFVKVIQAQVGGVAGLRDKALEFVDSTGRHHVLKPVTALDFIDGRNPWRTPSNGEPVEATWEVATYRLEGLSSPGTISFRLSDGQNYTVTPLQLRGNATWQGKEFNSADGSRGDYNTVVLWTVPVRNLSKMEAVFDGGWTYPLYSRYSYFPLTAMLSSGEEQGLVRPQEKTWFAGWSPVFRFYKHGLVRDNVLIGRDGWLLLPSEEIVSAGGCGSVTRVSPYRGKVLLDQSTGNTTMHWAIEPANDTARPGVVGFRRVDENGNGKVLAHHNAVNEDLAYSWDNCTGTIWGFLPAYDGEWH